MTLMAKLEVPPTVPDQIYAFRRGLSKRLQRLTACDPANGMQGYTDFYRLANCALASGKLGAQEFIVDAMGKNGEFDSFNKKVKKGAGFQRPKADGNVPHALACIATRSFGACACLSIVMTPLDTHTAAIPH